MENFLPLIIQVISGAVGGNIAGALMKNYSLGTLGNSIVGIIGGAIGGQMLGIWGVEPAGQSMDIGTVTGSIVGGGIGGAILMAIIGITRKSTN
jgi:uncharacterized membrane protein YeaQ/YmgE (transglycosylase-associated protein family)